MKNKRTGTSSGITFVGLLQIVFIVLKLCHVIDWSWPLVLLPLIICVGLAVIIFAIILIIVIFGGNHEDKV